MRIQTKPMTSRSGLNYRRTASPGCGLDRPRARASSRPGDIEEGLNAAASIGDDRIQQATTGRIDPESFTHGTSAQRVRWLRTGIQVGNPDACDTFSGDV